MKGIYFSQIRESELSQGAVMKVYDEIRAFERAGFEMRHVNAEPVSRGIRRTHVGKGVCAAFPFTYIFSRYVYNESLGGYDFYYFRFEAADYWLTRFLRKLRKYNPGALIIIEFPDYPNTTWLKGIAYTPLLIKDCFARYKYRKYVDRFAVLNPIYREIYGVKTVTYMNGIEVSRIPTRKRIDDTKKDRIDIIGICTMFPVHGYDRFINSLAKYYETDNARDIVFHIVGDGPGPELKKYVELVEQNNLSDRVVFEGRLTGNSLYELYDKCDLAVEVFAAFRKGLTTSSSLKSREYLSVGIPIITACNIDILEGKKFKYLLRFENSESIVDIGEVVRFCDNIYSNETREEVTANIRRFAEEHCSYDSTLKNVIAYIKEKP